MTEYEKWHGKTILLAITISLWYISIPICTNSKRECNHLKSVTSHFLCAYGKIIKLESQISWVGVLNECTQS